MKLETLNSSSTSHSSWYHELFYEKADPRNRDKWLMGDPIQIILFYSFYIVLITRIIPRYMQDKKAFDMDRPMTILNILICLVNAYFVVEGFEPWIFIYSWRCEPIDWSSTGLALKAANGCYLFLLSKFIYTFESVFLALRKSTSYTSTYLLIHHSSFPLIVWLITNYFPGGHATFAGVINSFQHMLLFGYRVIFVNLFPNWSKRLYNWRRPVALWLFVFQFFFIFIHTFQLVFSNECGFPMAYVYGISIYVTFITALLLAWVVPQMTYPSISRLTSIGKFGLDETFL